MRILFLSPWHPWPPDIGARIRNSHLLRALSERHAVSLISFAGESGAPDAAGLVELGLCRRAVVLARPAFSMTRLGRVLGLVSRIPSHIFAADSPEMAHAAGEILRKAPADLVIGSTIALGELAARLPARRRVLEEHNFMGRMMFDRMHAATSRAGRARAWATWRKDIAYERRLFGRFDLVTMVSEIDRAAVHDMGCATARLEVVPNGVDARACAAVKAEPLPGAIIYPGALTYSANLDAVAWFTRAIWPEIHRQRPQTTFLVTGRTEGVHPSTLADLGAAPGLRLTGYLPDVRPMLAGAAACVVPLRQGGGSRLKVLEAMALGVPVLSTTKGIEGLAITPGRHCLVADDADSFAALLIQLLNDPLLGRRLASAALNEVVPRYDWRPIADRFVNLIEEVAAVP